MLSRPLAAKMFTKTPQKCSPNYRKNIQQNTAKMFTAQTEMLGQKRRVVEFWAQTAGGYRFFC
ncbi:MAG: hypothetical protein J6J53_06375 [Muribaculaceae bacterium]|nr:hypothetical protein [Muribaculaceae bacterium]